MTHPMPSAAPGPVRTCIGCRERAAKNELLRVTVGSGPDGHPAVVPDPAGTAPGRGAHLHPTTACLDLAVRRRAFGRALRYAGDGPGLSADPVSQLILTPRPTTWELEHLAHEHSMSTSR